MVSSPGPSTRLARAASQRRVQRKCEQPALKEQEGENTVSTNVNVPKLSPTKDWWIQNGRGTDSTDDATLSSKSDVSNSFSGRTASNWHVERKCQQPPVKKKEEKQTVYADANSVPQLLPTKDWWVQSSIDNNSTDDMTISSQSVVSNSSNGTSVSSLCAFASQRLRQRKGQQKDASSTDKITDLNLSSNSNSIDLHPACVPQTVETPRRTNSSSSLLSLAQKRVSGSGAAVTSYKSSASAVSVGPSTPITTTVYKEEKDKLQMNAKLFEHKLKDATEAKNTAEKEKNEAISLMQNQIEYLQDKLRAITDQMSKTRVTEVTCEKQLDPSESHAAVLKELQQITKVNKELAARVNDAVKAEKALVDMKRKMSRMKSEHASIVDSLKRDVAVAGKIHDDAHSSFKHEMEAMKQSHEKEVSFYKEEIVELKEQLKIAMEIGEADRIGVKAIEKKLVETRKENCELVKQLQLKKDDVNHPNSNHAKDMKLLETELDKVYKAKIESENELKETKRQLSNALSNLEDMALDGGKLQTDIEGMMADFMKEKERLQNEVFILKRNRGDQIASMDELRRQKIATDIDSTNLQQNVQNLEMKLSGAEKTNTELKKEIEVLKGKLKKNAPEYSMAEKMNMNQLRADKSSLQNQLNDADQTIADLRQNSRKISMDLIKAQQTIHKLQSKEKYLENRVESLSNQISQTVQDYETKLASHDMLPPPPPPPPPPPLRPQQL